LVILATIGALLFGKRVFPPLLRRVSRVDSDVARWLAIGLLLSVFAMLVWTLVLRWFLEDLP
jgi:hypothetical protein